MIARWGGIILAAALMCAAYFQTSCVFGPNRYYGVMSHRGSRVFIRHDRWYYIGMLPDGWRDLKTGARAASWYNPERRAAISTDVLCENSMGDKPLESIAGDIAASIDDRRVTGTRDFMLDGRGALRESVVGTVDGVPMNMEIVVLKKNNCSFNMAAIVPPEELSAVMPDFETFVGGFHYDF